MPSDSPQPLATILADTSRRWFLGTETWIRVRTEDSAGSVAVVEHLIPPGAGSPWHIHNSIDEVLYIIDGTVNVIVGENRWTVGPGGCAFGPRGVPHGFRVEGEAPARILLVCTPGGDFDRFIYEASEPATTPGFPAPQPPDPRLGQLAATYGMKVLGPLPD
jgi:quercetin dioxygenase-like cupin family protein